MRRIALVAGAVVGILAMAHTAQAVVIGAIGDSITKAANADHLFDNPEHSWATGYDSRQRVNSHFHRLKKMDSKTKGYNFAVSGAKAAELASQVVKVNRKNPDYVTLAIGANDVCSWPEAHLDALGKFEADVQSTLQALVDHNNQVKITMIPIPNFEALYTAGKERGCSDRWSLFNLCQQFLGGGVTESDRSRFLERWSHANMALADIAATYAENVKYASVVAEYEFKGEHLSGIDCFHPSIAGQNLLAEESWNAGWYVNTEVFAAE